jgi:outer membrane biosynthesis protein TonB
MKNRRTIVTITGFLLFLLMVWVFTAVLLNSASADSGPFSFAVKSKLAADYGGEKTDGFLGVINLTIFSDVMRDLGLSPEEADEHSDAMKVAMDDPVPTATARNFEGEEPWTPTKTATKVPTKTTTPTHTPTPTYTPTRTRVPSKTPTATKKATKPPNTPAATATAAGPVDTQKPSICCLTLSPAAATSTPGAPLTSCIIDVVDLYVFDSAFSSGVTASDVHFKYRSPSVGWTVVPLNLLPIAPGGFVSGPGSDWDAHYGKTVTLSGVKNGEVIEVEARVEDNAGTGWRYTSSTYFYDYTGPDC